MDAQTAMDLFAKQLLSYNPNSSDHDLFYYRLPYERNYDLTNSIPLAPNSGNIIKFYQYRLDKPVVIFTDVVDTEAEEIGETAEEAFAEGEDGFDGEEFLDEDGNPRELSEEEMAALLTQDGDEEGYDKPPAGAAADDGEIYDKEPSAPPGDGAENWEAPNF